MAKSGYSQIEMKNQVNLIVFVFVLLWECTVTIPGHSTAGVNFVISLPLRFNETQSEAGEIYVSTEEWQATVTVLEPPADKTSVRRRKLVYIVDQNKTIIHYLDKTTAVNESGIHYATFISSNAPIRVFALTTTFFKSDADVFKVMPEQSCYTSYYVTTAIGHPFLMVFSFKKGAKVVITFPLYEMQFSVNCGLDVHCVSDNRMDFVLKPCSVWYLTIGEKDYQFQHTLIESDNPLYVVSGNAQCAVSDRGKNTTNSSDFCISSVTPTAAWGKEYFLPMFYGNIKTTTVLLRFSYFRFPFSTMIYEGGRVKNVTLKDHEHIYEHEVTNDFIFVKSDHPFGLYLFVPRSQMNHIFWNMAMLSVIPVAQWINGAVYIKSNMERGFYRYIFYLITQTNTNDILLPELNKSIEWKHALVVNNKSYSFIQFEHQDSTTRIFTKKPSGKIMLYVKCYLEENWATVILPYDFYQGKINRSSCTRNEAIVSDGIDNDCDGDIDEEIMNKKDDDNDGLVDEDFVEAYQDGVWGRWDHICDISKCKEKKIFLHVRSCNKKLPSRFGKPCPGSSYKCSPYSACPAKCLTNNFIDSCQCQIGCSNCSRKKPTCERCKPGYMATEFCRVHCPHGWGGRGCFKVHGKIADDDDTFSHRAQFYIIMAGGPSLIVLFICLSCVFRIKEEKRRASANDKNPTLDGDSEKNKEPNEHKETNLQTVEEPLRKEKSNEKSEEQGEEEDESDESDSDSD